MKKIAEMNMEVIGESFPTVQKIQLKDFLKDEKFEFLIPRYNPWAGWIEIFFISPQEEWIVIGDDPFEGTLSGSLEGSKFEETVSWKKDLNKMYLSGNVRRKYNGFESNAEFMENWKNFPRVEYTWTENHDFGKLETKITKNKIDENTADETLVKMIGAVKNRINMLGMGEKLNEIIVWKKKWETIGKLPSWKEKYCPIKSPIAGGTLTEIGAIYIEGHGNWYKFLELDDDRKYLIIEEGFTWGEFFYNDKKTLGKKGYNLYLYEIFDIDEGIKIIRDKSSGILESR